jgi:peptide/nickel transport system ATP-binding protein
LGLLDELRRDLGLTFVYITHDLASARFFANRIAIMYLGKIVETGPTAEIFDHPRHPYTQALLRAVPDPDPSRGVARDLPRGEVPDAVRPPAGCPFHPRCPSVLPYCGWEARDLGMVFEQRWTSVSPEDYARESRLIGDVDNLATVERSNEVTELSPASGSGQDLLDLLEAARADNPDEPFWQSVREMRANGGAVAITFVPRVVPRLLPVADAPVEVSCHLHHPIGES